MMEENLLKDQSTTQEVEMQDVAKQQQKKKKRRKGKKKSTATNSEMIEPEPSTNLTAKKTSVTVLQELLNRRGITPYYELVQTEGVVNESCFRYRVSFNDKDGIGVGRSKKEAKHAAAKALIEKLTGVNITDQISKHKKLLNGNSNKRSAAATKSNSNAS